MTVRRYTWKEVEREKGQPRLSEVPSTSNADKDGTYMFENQEVCDNADKNHIVCEASEQCKEICDDGENCHKFSEGNVKFHEISGEFEQCHDVYGDGENCSKVFEDDDKHFKVGDNSEKCHKVGDDTGECHKPSDNRENYSEFNEDSEKHHVLCEDGDTNHKLCEDGDTNHELCKDGDKNHVLCEDGEANHVLCEDGEANHELREDGEANHELRQDGEKNHELCKDGEKCHDICKAVEKCHDVCEDVEKCHDVCEDCEYCQESSDKISSFLVTNEFNGRFNDSKSEVLSVNSQEFVDCLSEQKSEISFDSQDFADCPIYHKSKFSLNSQENFVDCQCEQESTTPAQFHNPADHQIKEEHPVRSEKGNDDLEDARVDEGPSKVLELPDIGTNVPRLQGHPEVPTQKDGFNGQSRELSTPGRDSALIGVDVIPVEPPEMKVDRSDNHLQSHPKQKFEVKSNLPLIEMKEEPREGTSERKYKRSNGLNEVEQKTSIEAGVDQLTMVNNSRRSDLVEQIQQHQLLEPQQQQLQHKQQQKQQQQEQPQQPQNEQQQQQQQQQQQKQQQQQPQQQQQQQQQREQQQQQQQLQQNKQHQQGQQGQQQQQQKLKPQHHQDTKGSRTVQSLQLIEQQDADLATQTNLAVVESRGSHEIVEEEEMENVGAAQYNLNELSEAPGMNTIKMKQGEQSKVQTNTVDGKGNEERDLEMEETQLSLNERDIEEPLMENFPTATHITKELEGNVLKVEPNIFVIIDTASRNAIVSVEEEKEELSNICSPEETAEAPEMERKPENELEKPTTWLHSNGTSHLANKGVEVMRSNGSTSDCVDDREVVVDASDLHEKSVDESVMEATLEKILFSRNNSKVGIDSNHRCKDSEPTSVIKPTCASPGDPTPPLSPPYQYEQTVDQGTDPVCHSPEWSSSVFQTERTDSHVGSQKPNQLSIDNNEDISILGREDFNGPSVPHPRFQRQTFQGRRRAQQQNSPNDESPMASQRERLRLSGLNESPEEVVKDWKTHSRPSSGRSRIEPHERGRLGLLDHTPDHASGFNMGHIAPTADQLAGFNMGQFTPTPDQPGRYESSRFSPTADQSTRFDKSRFSPTADQSNRFDRSRFSPTADQSTRFDKSRFSLLQISQLDLKGISSHLLQTNLLDMKEIRIHLLQTNQLDLTGVGFHLRQTNRLDMKEIRTHLLQTNQLSSIWVHSNPVHIKRLGCIEVRASPGKKRRPIYSKVTESF